jgi:plastocyanin
MFFVDLRYCIRILFVIVITISTSYAFADNSTTAWKITIKTSPGINSTSFWPPEIHARQNDTIQWTNNDTTSHTVTSGVLDHPTYVGKIFDSGTIDPGKNYSLKISEHMWSGYYYFCKIHPWMTGKIDVGTAYLGISPDFNIETDKKDYTKGDIIRISGIVNNTYQITPVTIQIFDSNRNLAYLDKVSVLSDHSFFYELKTSSSVFKTKGDYKIKSMYGFPSTITDVNISFNDSQHSGMTSNVDHTPYWIKNNVKMWKNNEINDSEFVNGIQFLIKKGYMSIHTSNTSKINSGIIPLWIKNTITEWSNGTSSDDEFISSISYLLSHGVIQT